MITKNKLALALFLIPFILMLSVIPALASWYNPSLTHTKSFVWGNGRWDVYYSDSFLHIYPWSCGSGTAETQLIPLQHQPQWLYVTLDTDASRGAVIYYYSDGYQHIQTYPLINGHGLTVYPILYGDDLVPQHDADLIGFKYKLMWNTEMTLWWEIIHNLLDLQISQEF